MSYVDGQVPVTGKSIKSAVGAVCAGAVRVRGRIRGRWKVDEDATTRLSLLTIGQSPAVRSRREPFAIVNGPER